jgi:hypothetical protein
MERILRWQSQKIARLAVRAMLETVAGPEAHCEDVTCPGRQRYLIVTSLAAVVLDVGDGKTPVITAEPACSGRVQAEARMAAGQR